MQKLEPVNGQPRFFVFGSAEGAGCRCCAASIPHRHATEQELKTGAIQIAPEIPWIVGQPMVCEQHPWLLWPDGDEDCAGPGMPLMAAWHNYEIGPWPAGTHQKASDMTRAAS